MAPQIPKNRCTFRMLVYREGISVFWERFVSNMVTIKHVQYEKLIWLMMNADFKMMTESGLNR